MNGGTTVGDEEASAAVPAPAVMSARLDASTLRQMVTVAPDMFRFMERSTQAGKAVPELEGAERDGLAGFLEANGPATPERMRSSGRPEGIVDRRGGVRRFQNRFIDAAARASAEEIAPAASAPSSAAVIAQGGGFLREEAGQALRRVGGGGTSGIPSPSRPR